MFNFKCRFYNKNVFNSAVFRTFCSKAKKEPQVIKSRIVSSNNIISTEAQNIIKSENETVVQNIQLPLEKAKNEVLKSYGQPTHVTHPHLLRRGELTPFIKRNEYQQRRGALIDLIMTYVMKKVNRATKQHLIVIPAATKTYMSDKIPYFFRQNSDFFYLTGCMEPDCCLVITSTDNSSQPRVTMFTREKDDHSELWDGPRTTAEDAVELFGVDQALPISELHNYVTFFFKANRQSYIWYDFMNPLQLNIQKLMEEVLRDDTRRLWESPKNFIHKLRIKKSPAEINLMRKTCEIASESISSTMAMTKPGISEHQIYAKVDYECRMKGANYLAYPPVVASGERANIIHYINNNQIVRDGDLVLMDAGCEYYGYSSDITRTWPANGKFSKEQRELYEVVLSVQLDLIEMCEGFPTLDSLFDTMCLLLGKRLQQIGLISKVTSGESLIRQAYQFCPHHVSHYLGMDVHDTPSIPRNISIQPGMVFTVEPGVYISHKHSGVPKEYQGLGVRIEDDILITENGPLVLTKNCPKDVDEIEKIAAKSVLTQ